MTTQQYGMRLPVLLMRRVDAHAKLRGESRTQAVVELVETGLEAAMKQAQQEWSADVSGWPRQWVRPDLDVIVMQDRDEDGQPGVYVLAMASDGAPAGNTSEYPEFGTLEDAQRAAETIDRAAENFRTFAEQVLGERLP